MPLFNGYVKEGHTIIITVIFGTSDEDGQKKPSSPATIMFRAVSV